MNTTYGSLCILYNQRDATNTMFFIIVISAVHVSGARKMYSADNNKEHCKLYLVGYIKYTSSDARFHERYI